MSVLPLTNLSSLMDQIASSLDRLENQTHRLEQARAQSSREELLHEDRLQQKIQDVTKRIAELELQLSSLQKDVESPSEYIKKYDLARGEDISRLARLSARLMIGYAEHVHELENPRPKYLPSEGSTLFKIRTDMSYSEKHTGFCINHHQDRRYAAHLGYPGAAHDTAKLRTLGYKFEFPYYNKIDE